MANNSAFDLVAGGKVLIPSYQVTGTATGNPNLVGAIENLGSGSANIGAAGNIYLFASPVVGSLQAGGTGAEFVVATINLPASSFDAAGRGVSVTCAGSFGGTTNANKLIRVIFNPTGASTVGGTVGLGAGGVIAASTGTGSFNGSAFNFSASIYKYGISGSNTQMAVPGPCQVGAADTALTTPVAATAVEGSTIPICITAQSGVSGVAGLVNDVVINFVQVEAFN
jgi:hypothetical protein